MIDRKAGEDLFSCYIRGPSSEDDTSLYRLHQMFCSWSPCLCDVAQLSLGYQVCDDGIRGVSDIGKPPALRDVRIVYYRQRHQAFGCGTPRSVVRCGYKELARKPTS